MLANLTASDIKALHDIQEFLTADFTTFACESVIYGESGHINSSCHVRLIQSLGIYIVIFGFCIWNLL